MGQIRAIDVTKRFGGVTALQQVSLDVSPGELFGLVGPNGSGKTTLLGVLSRLIDVDSGSILIGDREFTDDATDNVARLGIGRTFQNLRLLSNHSVIENVMIGAEWRYETGTVRSILRPRSVRSAEAATREEAVELISKLGLERSLTFPVGKLPYGDQRRVEIARALASRPSVLLLDEPVAGMNTAEAQEIADLMLELQDDGITQILVEHNLELVMALCDRVAVLHSGRVIASGSPDEVASDPIVRVAFFGEGA